MRKMMFLLAVSGLLFANCDGYRQCVDVVKMDSVKLWYGAGMIMPKERHTWVVYSDGRVKEYIEKTMRLMDEPDSTRVRIPDKAKQEEMSSLVKKLFVDRSQPDLLSAVHKQYATDFPSLEVRVYSGRRTVMYSYYMGCLDAVYSPPFKRLKELMSEDKK